MSFPSLPPSLTSCFSSKRPASLTVSLCHSVFLCHYVSHPSSNSLSICCLSHDSPFLCHVFLPSALLSVSALLVYSPSPSPFVYLSLCKLICFSLSFLTPSSRSFCVYLSFSSCMSLLLYNLFTFSVICHPRTVFLRFSILLSHPPTLPPPIHLSTRISFAGAIRRNITPWSRDQTGNAESRMHSMADHASPSAISRSVTYPMSTLSPPTPPHRRRYRDVLQPLDGLSVTLPLTPDL